MLQFIPLEDDWDALEKLRPEDLIPFRVGLLDPPGTADQCTGSTSPAIFGISPIFAPMPPAVPPESATTPQAGAPHRNT
jgi:hypothetical protein